MKTLLFIGKKFFPTVFVLLSSIFFQSCQQEQQFFKKEYLEQEIKDKLDTIDPETQVDQTGGPSSVIDPGLNLTQDQNQNQNQNSSQDQNQNFDPGIIPNGALNGDGSLSNPLPGFPPTNPTVVASPSATVAPIVIPTVIPIVTPVVVSTAIPVVTPTVIPVVVPTAVATPVVIYGQMRDYFQQNIASDSHKVDILWVIDNSPSMDDEQAALAYNFDSFIKDFIGQAVDFKMAIVTTDGRTAYNGVMINPENTLNSAQAVANETKFISDFENYVQVGVRGSSNETGLKTADSFLSLSQYASFLRPEAYLIIVVLSDEEDKSPLTVAQYTEKFQSLKANPGMVKVYSIVNTEAIDQEVESIDVGRRYMSVSTATGGVISNIHDNFYQILSLMGERIVNLTNSFALSKIPSSADSVVIYVNGNKMVSGWQYDAISHAIKFEANSIPEEGAQITIEYLTVQ